MNIGNLVQADSTELTTIVSIDPIYAYFSMDELAALTFSNQGTRRGTYRGGPDADERAQRVDDNHPIMFTIIEKIGSDPPRAVTEEQDTGHLFRRST